MRDHKADPRAGVMDSMQFIRSFTLAAHFFGHYAVSGVVPYTAFTGGGWVATAFMGASGLGEETSTKKIIML